MKARVRLRGHVGRLAVRVGAGGVGGHAVRSGRSTVLAVGSRIDDAAAIADGQLGVRHICVEHELRHDRIELGVVRVGRGGVDGDGPGPPVMVYAPCATGANQVSATSSPSKRDSARQTFMPTLTTSNRIDRIVAAATAADNTGGVTVRYVASTPPWGRPEG